MKLIKTKPFRNEIYYPERYLLRILKKSCVMFVDFQSFHLNQNPYSIRLKSPLVVPSTFHIPVADSARSAPGVCSLNFSLLLYYSQA